MKNSKTNLTTKEIAQKLKDAFGAWLVIKDECYHDNGTITESYFIFTEDDEVYETMFTKGYTSEDDFKQSLNDVGKCIGLSYYKSNFVRNIEKLDTVRKERLLKILERY